MIFMLQFPWPIIELLCILLLYMHCTPLCIYLTIVLQAVADPGLVFPLRQSCSSSLNQGTRIERRLMTQVTDMLPSTVISARINIVGYRYNYRTFFKNMHYFYQQNLIYCVNIRYIPLSKCAGPIYIYIYI